MCLFYRKPDSCGRVSWSWHVRAFAGKVPRKEAPRTAQRPPKAPRPGPQQWFPGVSGSSVIIPFRFLKKRKVQAHSCTQKFYTAQIPETGILQMAGVSKCKRKWKLCRRGKKIKELVINVVLDMLHGESHLLKENQRENTGVREHREIHSSQKNFFLILDIYPRAVQ